MRSFTAAPAATVTMNPPTPMATYCEPSYGTGTGAGSGSGSEPSVPGAKVPFVSAQSARSMPDSAIARACALVIWFMAMVGSLALKAKKATVSAVSNVRMISVIGSAMPSSEPRRRASELVIDSSGERRSSKPPVGSPRVTAQANGLRLGWSPSLCPCCFSAAEVPRPGIASFRTVYRWGLSPGG